MTSVQLAAAAAATADPDARTLTGLVVPFGKVGQTSRGRLRFGPGSLDYSAPERVKLLVEHAQGHVVIGHGVSFDERPDGLFGTFRVPTGSPSPADEAVRAAALWDAANGLRDGLSVGVALDDASSERVRRARPGDVVDARGSVRETSLVAVPAFDDGRVAAAASHPTTDLVVSAWADVDTPTPEGTPTVTDTTPAQAATDATAATVDATASAEVVPAAAAPLAAAGAAAYVASDPATYTFDGRGPSMVRDAYAARMFDDLDARDRLARANRELADGNPSTHEALVTAAVGTTDTPALAPLVPAQPRNLTFQQAVDAKRPILSRITPIRINDATPFRIPREGEFDGVGDHVEGTAHVPEGTLAASLSPMVEPTAVSGAYRVSRELVDSSNPAVDRVALRAMLRDYRRHTEGKAAAVLTAVAATVGGVDTVMKLRAELVDFGGDDDEWADYLLAGRAFAGGLFADVDGDQRPQLPAVGATNAVGTVRPGYLATVDFTEVARTASVPADDAFLVEEGAVLYAESAVQQFRFDEVEGPGVIKLALWAYFGGGIVDASAVKRLRRGALA